MLKNFVLFRETVTIPFSQCLVAGGRPGVRKAVGFLSGDPVQSDLWQSQARCAGVAKVCDKASIADLKNDDNSYAEIISVYATYSTLIRPLKIYFAVFQAQCWIVDYLGL